MLMPPLYLHTNLSIYLGRNGLRTVAHPTNMPTSRPASIPKDLRPRYGLAAPSSAAAPGSPFFKRRAGVYAGGLTVITIAGTLIGASLKSSQQAEEKKQVQQKVAVDVGEQIAVLEETKLSLLQRKRQLEMKISEVRERAVKEEEVRREREEMRRKGDALKREMALGRTKD